MEHACAQCGATVEDGTPFCAGCGAPQIRVIVAAEDLPTVPQSVESGVPSPPLQPADFQTWTAHPSASNRVVWRAALPGCVVAGLLAGLGMMIPSLPVMALFMVASGGLAVALYHRREHLGEVTGSQGFRIGTLTGFFGALLVATVSLIGFTSAQNRELLHRTLLEKLNETAAANPDPEAQRTMQRITEMLATPHGLEIILGFGLFLLFVCFLMLSGAGGALGARLFGKHQPHA